jgi:hypothetical protein
MFNHVVAALLTPYPAEGADVAKAWIARYPVARAQIGMLKPEKVRLKC